ncbi:hypothetical protein KY343_02455 [Candidatus Woesearchaeota archaeon]|nr:hypothetical protein [Candidatus Woesearchaeota archaeon]
MSQFDHWYKEGEESWNSIDDLAWGGTSLRTNAIPGSPRDQRLKLEEIGFLINTREEGRAKCLLDEMIPVNEDIKAEHAFQSARCYFSPWYKGYSLKKALKEIRKSIDLKPDNEKYWECEREILHERKQNRIAIGVAGTVGSLLVSGLGYAVYQLLS